MLRNVLLPYALPVLAIGVTGAGAAAQSLPEAWRAEGFETPESALYDAANGAIFVSNINGAPDAADGNGYISRLGLDGSVAELKWVEGLDAPKGMAVVDGRLYVADIDELVEIDIAQGEIAARHPAEGALFLNDVAADPEGRVYVSDLFAGAIYRLADGSLERWVEDPALVSPNGLLVEGGAVVVASMGEIGPGFELITPGHLLSVDLASGAVADIGSGEPIGGLDGIESDGQGGWYVSDYLGGRVLHVAADGSFEVLAAMSPGTADIGYAAEEGLILVPLMMEGVLVALEAPR